MVHPKVGTMGKNGSNRNPPQQLQEFVEAQASNDPIAILPKRPHGSAQVARRTLKRG
jgi:hypothetical protein